MKKVSKKYHIDSLVVHSGNVPDPSTGAIVTPIFQTSTYIHSKPGEHQGYDYSRKQNPTRKALETTLASLEDARYCTTFASGMASIEMTTKLLVPGDTIVSTNDLYGGTYRFFSKVLSEKGINTKFISLTDIDLLKSTIDEKTKMIWIETPTNPLITIIDIEKVAAVAHSKNPNILVCVDNTFASPYLQKPLHLGADIVSHSITKYLNGHSDVIMGALMCNEEKLGERIEFLQTCCGAVPSPNDCYLVQRGIKTLAVRMERHCSNAMKIAQYLSKHDKVGKVHYPGLKSHPQHELATRQMRDYGGMVSFELKKNDRTATFEVIKKLQLFSLAESLGAVESLVGFPALMTHAIYTEQERAELGITDSFIRLSIGIENVEDLIKDLSDALQ